MNEATEHVFPTIGRHVEGYSAPVVAGRAREEVTRCRDCSHFASGEEFWGEVDGMPILMATADTCDFWAGTKCKVTPDGFCRWAERKESR